MIMMKITLAVLPLWYFLVALPQAVTAFQTPTMRSLCSLSTRSNPTVHLSLDDEELPKFSSDIVSNNNPDNAKKSEAGSKRKKGKLLEQINEFGLSLKSKAQDVNTQAGQADQKKSRILLKTKACLYYTLYIAYRGYRGFFVILPAVFREVYAKMETAVDFRVLDDEEDSLTSMPGDVNPSTGKVRLRTRVTVSILAGIVTLTYVIGGLARVLMKFVKTILSTSSLSGSFSAAVEEVEGNEGRLLRLSGKKSNGDTKKKGTINGN